MENYVFAAKKLLNQNTVKPTMGSMSVDTRDNTKSQIDTAILYWGTPVVIISSLNEDGTTNLSPMSSAFWLGNTCMLGLGSGSKTPENLLRQKQCVLNLPSDDMVDAVNGLARTTGTPAISEKKVARGYRYEKDKFACSGLTPQKSELVQPQRVAECPVQMEAELINTHIVGQDLEKPTGVMVFEVRVLRTFVEDRLRMEGKRNRIDPDKWNPMIMSFQELYGLRPNKVGQSKLGQIEEELYRVPPAVPKTVGNDSDRN